MLNNKFQALQIGQRAKRMLVLAAAVGVASANAAGEGPDVTTIVASITALVATVGLVGNADLLVRVAVKAYTYVRLALGR